MSDGSSISRWHFKLIITQTYSIIDVIITQLFLLTSSLCWPDKNRNIGIAYSFVYISIIFLIYLGLLFTSLFDVFSFSFQCNAVTTTYNINFHKYKILNHRYHRQGRRQGKSLEGAKLPRGSRGQRPLAGVQGRSPLVGVRGQTPLKLTPF